jgi:hypothetical protein
MPVPEQFAVLLGRVLALYTRVREGGGSAVATLLIDEERVGVDCRGRRGRAPTWARRE